MDTIKFVTLCEPALGLHFAPDEASSLRELVQRLDADQAMTDPRWKTYCLATVYRECGRGFAPVCEKGPLSYFSKYEPGTVLGKNLGNTRSGDGFLFRGRGFVQVTGRSNYSEFGKLLNIDLIGNPDKANDFEVAYQIMSQGMRHGLFTGVGLSRYINPSVFDPVNARKIINGLDHAVEIAGNAQKFAAVWKEAA